MALFAGTCRIDYSNLLCAEVGAAASVQLVLFSLDGQPDSPCHSTDNPFLSRSLSPTILYQGGGIPEKSPKDATRSEEIFGPIESTTRTFSIATDATLPTGCWAFISYASGDVLGGQVTKAGRIVPGFVSVTVDTNKVVPVKPADVGAPNWPRQVEN